MTKTKAILLLAVVLVFAAGTAMGVFISRTGHSPRPHRPDGLDEVLNLTEQQKEQRKKIFEGTRAMFTSMRRQNEETRSQFRHERDQAIVAMLSEDQRAHYEQIRQDYTRKVDQLSEQAAKEGRRAFEEAVAQTKKVLTPEQAAKYEEWLKKRREEGRKGGDRGGDFGGARHRRPATQSAPATVPVRSEQPPPLVGD